jgi:cytochrome c551/c552
MHTMGCLKLFVWTLLLIPVAARGADLARPLRSGGVHVEALPEQADKMEAGLTLTFSSADQPDAPVDATTSRLPALYVTEGGQPSPFLKPGAYRATFTGTILIRARATYTFSAQGRGGAKLTIGDQVVLDTTGDDMSKTSGAPTQIKRGKLPFTLTYTSPEQGDAVLRLFWSSEDFSPEPVPPAILSHNVSDATFRKFDLVRQGRTLFSENRCTACHVAGDDVKAAVQFDAHAMPELSQDAPNLHDVAGRLKQDWLAAWVANPAGLNPRTRMPRLFASNGADAGQVPQAAADVAAYLATLGTAPADAEPAEASAGAIADGVRLYTSLGCIACHTPPDATAEDTVTPKRIPHRNVRAKYRPQALKDFLKNPQGHYAWSRMPNFKLTDAEVGALFAYLYAKARQGPVSQAPTGDAQKGKVLFTSAGCLNCHSADAPAAAGRTAPRPLTPLNTLADLSKSDWTRGCLADSPEARGSAPGWHFAAEQRAALRQFAAADLTSILRDSPADAAQRFFVESNCRACHARDDQTDILSTLKPEIDALQADLPPVAINEKLSPDQARPLLTWIGEKLRPEWTEQFVSGQIAYKPRPWLASRMPAFAPLAEEPVRNAARHAAPGSPSAANAELRTPVPSRAHSIAAGFAAQHGYPAQSPPLPKPDPKLADLGWQLANKTGGLACMTCHAIGNYEPTGAFEAPAPNFAHTAERLTKTYYDRWTWNPQRVEPGTRMPTFPTPEGKTAIKNILDGDAKAQLDALWQYILEGHDIQPPANQ